MWCSSIPGGAFKTSHLNNEAICSDERQYFKQTLFGVQGYLLWCKYRCRGDTDTNFIILNGVLQFII